MSLQDYVNRTYDYLGLQGATDAPGQLGLTLVTENNSGQICTGIQKLAQRWLLEFFTETESMPGLPGRGSPFMTFVRTGQIRTNLDAGSLFSSAELDIRKQLQAEETTAMPADERLNYASLESLTILPGYIQLRVKINSLAGDSRSIIVPVSTLP